MTLNKYTELSRMSSGNVLGTLGTQIKLYCLNTIIFFFILA